LVFLFVVFWCWVFLGLGAPVWELHHPTKKPTKNRVGSQKNKKKKTGGWTAWTKKNQAKGAGGKKGEKKPRNPQQSSEGGGVSGPGGGGVLKKSLGKNGTKNAQFCFLVVGVFVLKPQGKKPHNKPPTRTKMLTQKKVVFKGTRGGKTPTTPWGLFWWCLVETGAKKKLPQTGNQPLDWGLLDTTWNPTPTRGAGWGGKNKQQTNPL